MMKRYAICTNPDRRYKTDHLRERIKGYTGTYQQIADIAGKKETTIKNLFKDLRVGCYIQERTADYLNDALDKLKQEEENEGNYGKCKEIL